MRGGDGEKVGVWMTSLFCCGVGFGGSVGCKLPERRRVC